MIYACAEWIKLAAAGSVGTPIGGPLVPHFFLDELQAIIRAT
jgi:hypothetical protein